MKALEPGQANHVNLTGHETQLNVDSCMKKRKVTRLP